MFFIQTSHESRIIVACILFVSSYIAIAFSIHEKQDENISLPAAVAGCVLHQLARSIGEATILGYLKALP
jgi:mannose/fructose/N-acetylgalactosamine-specific phosphotransferase system component IIC